MNITDINMRPLEFWKNKNGTSDRSCSCGSWKKHWLNFSKQPWPTICSVSGCNNIPTVGGHVYCSNVHGEKIVPLCDSCNHRTDEFCLKLGTIYVSANKSETCES